MSKAKHPISVVILTKDEEVNIGACLDCLGFCDDIVLYDSFSTDRTVEIASARPNVRVIQRKFDNWAAHQNWGCEHIKFRHPWVLYLDADERIDDTFVRESMEASDPASPISAYRVRRKDMFMGRWLRHAQLYPTWFVRLYRPEKIRFERQVHPPPVVDGPIGELEGHLIHYPFSKGVAQWLERHNSYSSFEAAELLKVLGGSRKPLTGLFSRDANVRRATLKDIFYRLPMRPQVKWLYYILVRAAWMDGQAGWTYARLTYLYEYMISIKAKELRLRARGVEL